MELFKNSNFFPGAHKICDLSYIKTFLKSQNIYVHVICSILIQSNQIFQNYPGQPFHCSIWPWGGPTQTHWKDLFHFLHSQNEKFLFFGFFFQLQSFHNLGVHFFNLSSGDFSTLYFRWKFCQTSLLGVFGHPLHHDQPYHPDHPDHPDLPGHTG